MDKYNNIKREVFEQGTLKWGPTHTVSNNYPSFNLAETLIDL